MKTQISKLSKLKVDQFFPSLLSPEDKLAINEFRGKRIKRLKYDAGYTELDNGVLTPTEQSIIVPEGYGDDNFDILKYMKDCEDPLTGTIRDLKIDDRDLYQAKSFYDFAFNVIKKDAHPPWAVQMWTGLMLFGEICPCCSNKKWLDIENVDKNYPSKDLPEHLQILENGVCPKCKRKKWELIEKYGLRNYQQLDNVLGQRSGKSSGAAYMSAYQAHKYLKFPPLASLTNLMQASTELTGTFVSLSFAKAQGLLWTPFKSLIDDSQWFQEYFKLLDYYGKKYGQVLYQNNSLFLKFKNRNLRFYPSGPKSETLRGDTRIWALLDELGLFPLPKGDEEEDEKSERANADEAHKSLMNSLATVQAVSEGLLKKGYSAAPSAILACVSSPISLRDKVMRLYRESKTEEGRKYILGINLPTWKVNPGLERSSPVIAMAYNSNHEKAERDFGANPPQVHSVFIQKKTVETQVFVNGKNTHELQYCYDLPGEIYGTVIRKRQQLEYPSLVTLDAGYSNNSFTLIGGHYDFEAHKSVVSTVVEIMPHEGRTVNFNRVYNMVILPVLKDLNGVALIADRWNSLDLLHRAKEDMGNNPQGKPFCLTKQFTPRRRHFDQVVSMLENHNIICPSISDAEHSLVFEKGVENYREEMLGKPVPHLALQMITVRNMGEGRCPDKGEGFTDDIFRSFILFGALLHEPKVMERLKEARNFLREDGRNASPPPLFVGRSGGYTRGMM